MPFDATLQRDTLDDIDITKPLTRTSIQRIVRATQAAGLLAMDHFPEMTGRRRNASGYLDPVLYRYSVDTCPYFTPHGAVDAFLSSKNRRDSCPCNFQGHARGFLEKLNNLHRRLLFYRACGAQHYPDVQHMEQQFATLLYGEPE
jgi:hypothetical protein